TFHHNVNQGTSVIDLVITNSHSHRLINHVRVSRDVRQTDHCLVSFDIEFSFHVFEYIPTFRYKEDDDAGWERFVSNLDREVVCQIEESLSAIDCTPNTVDECIEKLTKMYISAADISLVKRKLMPSRDKRPNAPWWDNDLDALDKSIKSLERAISKTRSLHHRSTLGTYRQRMVQQFNQLSIKKRKESFDKFIAEVENKNAFGNEHRLIKSLLNKSNNNRMEVLNVPGPSPQTQSELLVRHHFPDAVFHQSQPPAAATTTTMPTVAPERRANFSIGPTNSIFTTNTDSPQGSALSPLLWNIGLNPLLQLECAPTGSKRLQHCSQLGP
ncbi:hypothetical protein, partial [Clostridioides difficile]|uniref:hypothetical protein n=1 Tax=Clostridioides difficile TaxID=1496 RepID=UPI0013EF8F2D